MLHALQSPFDGSPKWAMQSKFRNSPRYRTAFRPEAPNRGARKSFMANIMNRTDGKHHTTHCYTKLSRNRRFSYDEELREAHPPAPSTSVELQLFAALPDGFELFSFQ